MGIHVYPWQWESKLVFSVSIRHLWRLRVSIEVIIEFCLNYEITERKIPMSRARIKNLKKKIAITADKYYDNLSAYCDIRNETPLELIEGFKQDKKVSEDVIKDHLNSLTEKGVSPKSVNLASSAIKNRLARDEQPIAQQIN
jgi:hypothetical protein